MITPTLGVDKVCSRERGRTVSKGGVVTRKKEEKEKESGIETKYI
jgi:hypothetical protein